MDEINAVGLSGRWTLAEYAEAETPGIGHLHRADISSWSSGVTKAKRPEFNLNTKDNRSQPVSSLAACENYYKVTNKKQKIESSCFTPETTRRQLDGSIQDTFSSQRDFWKRLGFDIYNPNHKGFTALKVK